jgi:hypothetical protein
MKIAIPFVIVVLLLIACGCTTQAPAGTPTAPPAASPAAPPNKTTPNLTGIWSGPSTGYIQAEGFVYYPVSFHNITAQKGQVFAGRKEYPRMDRVTHYENFSGFITDTGEIYEADSLGGVATGKLTGPDSMELNYVEEGSDMKVLMISLNRQKS